MTDTNPLMEALRRVRDPETQKDIVAAGRIAAAELRDGRAAVTVTLAANAGVFRGSIQRDIEAALAGLPGVREVGVTFQEPGAAPGPGGVPGVRTIVAVGSGKGGVGKSTVAVNLAVALAEEGARIGLLDADIYGPSIPLMMGVHEQPDVVEAKLIPPERYGVRLMSLGFLLPDHTSPVVWRGPMVGQAVRQMLHDVRWGDIEILVVDLPPGTGDAALTLAQTIPLTGALIVMTPQDVAIQIATKTLNMFKGLRVPILGIMENMSWLPCPECGKRVELFGKGGGRAAAKSLEVPFLGEVPLDIELRKGGDEGRPVVVKKPSSEAAATFRRVASELRAQLLAGSVDR